MDLLCKALEESFVKNANNIALEVEGAKITYQELGFQSKILASLILNMRGGGGHLVVNSDKILIFASRSALVYTSILACVLVYQTYVPLNPKFPSQRLLSMIKRSGAGIMFLGRECYDSFYGIAESLESLVIVVEELGDLEERFPKHKFIVIPKILELGCNKWRLLETHIESSLKSNSQSCVAFGSDFEQSCDCSSSSISNFPSKTAYLLFTSGSTGEPKGVMVSRDNLFAYAQRMLVKYRFSPQDRISNFFDITFDLSMHDIFCTFLSGATLCVIPKQSLFNPIKFIIQNNLSVFFAVPSLIAYLIKFKALKPNLITSLRLSLFCGEEFPTQNAKLWSEMCKNSVVENLYGPTEATIAFMSYCYGAELQEKIVPLGIPFDGLLVSLRDEKGNEVTKGEKGEIWLGGDQIAQGYLNDREKTEQKFITKNGVRWYKTGDLGILKEIDGEEVYCFLGRVDFQVKIQGFRVELLEIDNVLREVSKTQSVSVVIKNDGITSIVGVIEAKSIKSDEILKICKQRLPHYMIPTQILALESFPLNSNGKIDRERIRVWVESQFMENKKNFGVLMYELAQRLFKIPRSLSGNGNRETLRIINSILGGNLKVYEVPSHTQAFDWEIPKEWNVNEAYIITPSGEKICDFGENNLHLVGYSVPVRESLTFEELKSHLHSLKEQKNAIPYITSYYKEYWGFCLSLELREKLEREFGDSKEKFEVIIDSKLESGFMSYGEVVIKGESDKEIVLSTYICHPQMANNELSGICVATYLAKYLSEIPHFYTYRILFLPETIGAIYYLSQHLEELREKCVAGFVLTCIGDEGAYSYLESRAGNNLADRAAKHILNSRYRGYKTYSYLQRGSDERQYCAPGVDLPFCTLMRSKFGEYSQYHTSLDDLSFISPKGLQGGFVMVREILEVLEINGVYKNTILCEPQLGKRGLYPQLSTKETFGVVKDMRNLLMYCDGKLDLIEIADKCGFCLLDMKEWIRKFVENGLLRKE